MYQSTDHFNTMQLCHKEARKAAGYCMADGLYGKIDPDLAKGNGDDIKFRNEAFLKSAPAIKGYRLARHKLQHAAKEEGQIDANLHQLEREVAEQGMP